MTVDGRAVLLAHLSLIDLAAADLVETAGAAGFDGVSVRLTKTSDGRGHDLIGDARALTATTTAMAATGTFVWDTEVVRLRAGTDVSEYRPFLETAAALGGRYLIATVEDPDRERAVDTFAALCELAAPFGIGCAVEFMVFSATRTLADARAVVDAAGASDAVVLVDALHLARSGGTVAEVATLPSRRVAWVQLCDAPNADPAADAATAREEAVRARLVPGTGRLPLTELVAALPPDLPVSVEAPAAPGSDAGPLEFAHRAMRSTRELLSRADTGATYRGE